MRSVPDQKISYIIYCRANTNTGNDVNSYNANNTELTKLRQHVQLLRRIL